MSLISCPFQNISLFDKFLINKEKIHPFVGKYKVMFWLASSDHYENKNYFSVLFNLLDYDRGGEFFYFNDYIFRDESLDIVQMVCGSIKDIFNIL